MSQSSQGMFSNIYESAVDHVMFNLRDRIASYIKKDDEEII